MLNSYCHFKMEIIVRLFPSGKTGWDRCRTWVTSPWTPLLPEPRQTLLTLPRSPVMIGPGAGCCGYLMTPCSLFQTQAAQTVLQSREGPAMTRTAVLLGLMGIGMSGYSSRQLTLHCKPSSHLFRWCTWWKKSVHTYKCRLTLDRVSPKVAATGGFFLQVLCSWNCFSLCINPTYSNKLCHSCWFCNMWGEKIVALWLWFVW